MKRVILAAILAAGALNATDFSSMSTEDLVSMRGTVTTEEQADFRAELQSRVSSMTTDEREELGVTPGVNAKGESRGVATRDGSGEGSMGEARGGTGAGLGGGMGSEEGGFGGGMGGMGSEEGGFGGGMGGMGNSSGGMGSGSGGGHGRGGMR